VPPDADGEYVWRMEDVIQTYMRPYDVKRPVVCFDEASRQLFGEVRQAKLPEPGEDERPGKRAKSDYEYERKGTCNLFMVCEPLRGWRHVKVTQRRTRRDYYPGKEESHSGASGVLDAGVLEVTHNALR
jgi:hypothetical protein